MGYWDDYRRFKPSMPREAKGGIKSQSKRGTFGESWWARRWIAVLESFNIGARLGRGRSYARRGQVLSVEIDEGKVNAKVQGSRPKPYHIKLEVKTLSASDWQKLAKVLSRQAIFSAKLLMGEMPLDIEKAFKEAGLSLFPERLKDLKTDCSCPDWSNPCKHIAAVYYLLAEEFDRDPFMIFRLRGKEKDDLIAALRELRTGGEEAPLVAETSPLDGIAAAEPPLPLEECLDHFWVAGEGLASFHPDIAPPPVLEAVLKRLGPPPIGKKVEEALEAPG